MRAAEVQLVPVIAGVAANLEACERLADVAGAAGAEWKGCATGGMRSSPRRTR